MGSTPSHSLKNQQRVSSVPNRSQEKIKKKHLFNSLQKDSGESKTAIMEAIRLDLPNLDPKHKKSTSSSFSYPWFLPKKPPLPVPKPPTLGSLDRLSQLRSTRTGDPGYLEKQQKNGW